MNQNTEKMELIEAALLANVSGGERDVCGFKCSIFSRDICNIDICSMGTSEK